MPPGSEIREPSPEGQRMALLSTEALVDLVTISFNTQRRAAIEVEGPRPSGISLSEYHPNSRVRQDMPRIAAEGGGSLTASQVLATAAAHANPAKVADSSFRGQSISIRSEPVEASHSRQGRGSSPSTRAHWRFAGWGFFACRQRKPSGELGRRKKAGGLKSPRIHIVPPRFRTPCSKPLYVNPRASFFWLVQLSVLLAGLATTRAKQVSIL